MYLPSHFAENDPQQLHQIIQHYPLGTLITQEPTHQTAQQLPTSMTAHHLPFHLRLDGANQDGVLQGHVARANPVWQEAAEQPVLIIFRGPEHYITPNWYPSKQVHGKAVPTWNYVAVHAYGILRITHDKTWLRNLVTQLTQTHEQPFSNRWQVDDAPADYLDTMLSAIVGLEIHIEHLFGKFKLSQNKTPQDRAGVRQGLGALPTDAAQAMKNRIE